MSMPPSHEPAGTLKAFFPVSEVRTKKFQSDPVPLAKITAHPKSFAAKSIIIITCGDEFPMMVAGPQQPLLIMTFCSCWQSLPRQMAHSQQPACQPEHTHNTEFGPHRQNQGGSRNGKADFICGKAPVFKVVSKLCRSDQR